MKENTAAKIIVYKTLFVRKSDPFKIFLITFFGQGYFNNLI
jgi:hypothetical protein